MRLVLDTHVLLSGLFTRGVCEALLDACLGTAGYMVVLSEYILTEFAQHAETKFGAPAADVRAAVEFLRSQAELVEPADVHAEACDDPDDLPVLGTAVAGKVHCLVTGDHALLRLGQFGKIAIVAPRALYERLP